MVSIITFEERDCNVINKAEEDILKQSVEQATLNKWITYTESQRLIFVLISPVEFLVEAREYRTDLKKDCDKIIKHTSKYMTSNP